MDANLIIYKEFYDTTTTHVYNVSATNQLMNIIDVNIDLPCYNINVSNNIVKIQADNATPNIICIVTCKQSADADQYYSSLFTRQQQQNYHLKG